LSRYLYLQWSSKLKKDCLQTKAQLKHVKLKFPNGKGSLLDKHYYKRLTGFV